MLVILQRAVVSSRSFLIISNEYLLDAVIIGDKMDANKYIVKDIVKQVTDRNVSVIEDKFGVHLQMNLVVEWRNIPGEDESEEV